MTESANGRMIWSFIPFLVEIHRLYYCLLASGKPIHDFIHTLRCSFIHSSHDLCVFQRRSVTALKQNQGYRNQDLLMIHPPPDTPPIEKLKNPSWEPLKLETWVSWLSKMTFGKIILKHIFTVRRTSPKNRTFYWYTYDFLESGIDVTGMRPRIP